VRFPIWILILVAIGAPAEAGKKRAAKPAKFVKKAVAPGTGWYCHSASSESPASNACYRASSDCDATGAGCRFRAKAAVVTYFETGAAAFAFAAFSSMTECKAGRSQIASASSSTSKVSACKSIGAVSGQKLAEKEAGSENDRLVTVTINGAVIGPVDQNGAAWDGPGWSDQNVKWFLSTARKTFEVGPTGALGKLFDDFAGALATGIIDSVEPPDPSGVATLFLADGTQTGTSRLIKAQDSFTPTWDSKLEGVRLLDGRIVVRLVDTDLVEDDPIAELMIEATTLQAAASSGGIYAIDASDATNGMVQRVFITVN
jgi:hypothetical protein